LQPKFKPIWPPSQRGRWPTHPLLGFIQKTVQFQGKLFTSTFLQAAEAGPILGIDFLRKFKVIVSPELSQIQFACSAAALSAHILPSAAPSSHILPPAAPPASYCSSSFSSRKNKSLLDPPSLFQKIPGDHWQPLGFFSRKLTDTESHNSTFDRELLAAQAAIKHLHHFCKGRAFQLWTDHKPLVTAISRVSAPLSPRQQRHLAFLSQNLMYSLWTPAYTPIDHLTSWVYSTTFVQYLYISCYLSDNKPVLSYLLSRLLPQW
jgi:hypothetical protein